MQDAMLRQNIVELYWVGAKNIVFFSKGKQVILFGRETPERNISKRKITSSMSRKLFLFVPPVSRCWGEELFAENTICRKDYLPKIRLAKKTICEKDILQYYYYSKRQLVV